MRKLFTIALAGALVVLAGLPAAHAVQPFDGLWVTSRKDCRGKDGPDSKTFIDLDNVIKASRHRSSINMKIIAASIARLRPVTGWC